MQKQQTLKGAFTLKGKGLHTGQFITAVFNPAEENYGYKIQRIDIEGQPIIDCNADLVGDTQRGTVLVKGDIKISTIEHAMAALYASGIDNCLIQLDGPEMPILDGSAIPFVEEIQKVGLQELEVKKEYYVVKQKMEIRGENGEHLILLPDDHFCINAQISFDSKILDNQFANLDDIADFPTEIASARTFVFVREIEPLLNLGLIKGGDLDNAIVIYERELPQERYDKLADTLGIPRMDATKLGYINHKPLAWDNETARHKLLDIIGDLALVGKPIRGRIIATKPGHTINNKFARAIKKDIKKHEVQCPDYNPNNAPLMDVNKIRHLLPHRYPMQLVDKVIAVDEMEIVAVKNVTSNEPFFTGHFPQEPVMPGVLIVEAMAQAGGLLVLSNVEEPERWSTYFMKIDNVKFRRKVVPGDTLIFKVKMLGPLRRGIATMAGLVFVGETVAAEAEFTAQIIKNK
ncbi:MAG: bifunctional UDP-3-O-[3-hydroxymyristoyl] N-acetylglucosamine deacetylase/3-hydroxyacyl-ACP dehydratase [Bacteroidaceae bacterium]|nr:bifunctional UDP-3-O-[3-hydroxymyristoyl] N-acetylglucosamine deacetylase/3-hydroxyacyl-ACP dehydratase [Bacteroidaceae bacterium]